MKYCAVNHIGGQHTRITLRTLASCSCFSGCLQRNIHSKTSSLLHLRRWDDPGQDRRALFTCRSDALSTDVDFPTTPADRPDVVDEEEAPSTSVTTADTWELDFSSRPILDARGKKRWELLICSPDRSWIYSRWFPNNKINSTQVHAPI